MSAAIERIHPQGVTPFEPTSLEQAMTLAQTLARSGLIPRHLVGKPADILVTLLKGRELGLSTMQAVSGIHVINGKAELDAGTLAGIVVRHPDVCEYLTLVESTATQATYETKRRGAPKPVRLSFTMAQAQRAGLTRNPTWTAYPEAMLRARAVSAIAKAVYPDLAAGLYAPGEISEPVSAPPLPQEVQPPPVPLLQGSEPEPPPPEEPTDAEYSQPGDEDVFTGPPPTDEGWPEEEPPPAEEPTPSGVTIPGGKSRGVPLPKATTKDITYWRDRNAADLKDHSKARYHEGATRFVAAADAELARRKGGQNAPA